jgi:hypothetical protein
MELTLLTENAEHVMPGVPEAEVAGYFSRSVTELLTH